MVVSLEEMLDAILGDAVEAALDEASPPGCQCARRV
jgi:hypothetical protein